MIETVYIARHGFRLNWVTNDRKSATGLPRDPPLAAFGEQQSRELANHFASLSPDERPTALFSSPFYRCLQTVQPVAVALNLPIYVEHGLSEWFSPVVPGTGLHPRPGSATSLKAYFPEIDDEAWSTIYYPSRKGEDVKQVHDRTGAFLEVLFPEIERRFPGKHRCILLATHAATFITLCREMLGNRQLPLRIGCCTITEMRKKSGTEEQVRGAWEATKMADGSHLKDGSLRDWGFEDIEVANGQVISDPGMPGTEGVEFDDPVGLQITPAAKM